MSLDELAGFGFTILSFEILGLSAFLTFGFALQRPSFVSTLFCIGEIIMLIFGVKVYRYFMKRIIIKH